MKFLKFISYYCLEKYELAELDRKKPKVIRKGLSGSFIRYQSTTMPLIEEISSSSTENKDEVESRPSSPTTPMDIDEPVEIEVLPPVGFYQVLKF